jgi:hypothetical protein
VPGGHELSRRALLRRARRAVVADDARMVVEPTGKSIGGHRLARTPCATNLDNKDTRRVQEESPARLLPSNKGGRAVPLPEWPGYPPSGGSGANHRANVEYEFVTEFLPKICRALSSPKVVSFKPISQFVSIPAGILARDGTQYSIMCATRQGPFFTAERA